MNLIPIDAGGTPTEVGGGDASPGGDFAALMSGLMTGDTQIVPLIEIPRADQLSEGAETTESGESADVAASILEFIGTPPSGLAISPGLVEAAPNTLADVTDESHGPIAPIEPIGPTETGGPQVSVAAAPEAGIVGNAEADAAVESADGPELATVHPISHLVATAAATTSPVTDAIEGAQTEHRRQPTLTGLPATATEAVVSPPEDRPAGAPASSAGDRLRSAVFVTADPLDTPTQRGLTEPVEPAAPKPGATAAEPNALNYGLGSDVELDTAATTRPVSGARTAGAISQPAMVGIARRVEQAISALATKPDPKIVTLQLDELDGLRLTVALRPDGLHLSSSGDATLTTEIERALASRGFDMASTGGEHKQSSDEGTDDGWRPQSAQPGRSRPTNQPGIRL